MKINLYADIDTSNDYIAIVEGPYSEEISKNRGYIVNAENKIVTDIKELLTRMTKFSLPPYFIGIEFTAEGFMFYINYNNRDFRFLFDPKSKEMGGIIESR